MEIDFHHAVRAAGIATLIRTINNEGDHVVSSSCTNNKVNQNLKTLLLSVLHLILES